MEEQQKQFNKGIKIFWIVFDIIFFGVYILYALSLTFFYRTIQFYDGLYDKHYSFVLLLIPFVFWYITLGCIFVLLIRMYYWYLYFKSKRVLWLVRVVVLLPLVFFAVNLIYPISYFSDSQYMEGFHQRMQERLDVNGIREWLGSLEDDIFDGEYYDLLYQMNDKILPFAVPQEISYLSDNVHYLVFYKENQMRCLRIEWGGALGHWGVVIGPEEMPIPPSTHTEDYGEYRLRLEDGVYVWSGP